MTLSLWLRLAGVFTLVLGIAHFFLPALLKYREALLDHPAGWKPAHPFRLWPSRYTVTLTDLYGILWVMNHAASYVLVSLGLLDLFGAEWLQSGAGRWLALWIAGWWLLRAASQLYLGRRAGDWLILVWFAAFGLLHLAIALQ